MTIYILKFWTFYLKIRITTFNNSCLCPKSKDSVKNRTRDMYVEI